MYVYGLMPFDSIVADCDYHIFVLMSIILLKKNQNIETFLDCASLSIWMHFLLFFFQFHYRFFHSESDFCRVAAAIATPVGCLFAYLYVCCFFISSSFSLAMICKVDWLSIAMLGIGIREQCNFYFSVGKLIYWMCRECVYICWYVLCTAHFSGFATLCKWIGEHKWSCKAQNNKESLHQKFKRCAFMMNIVWHFIWKQIICFINDETSEKRNDEPVQKRRNTL